MTTDDTPTPTDQELVDKMQTLTEAAAAYKAAYVDFFTASFYRLKSIVVDAIEAYDDMAGQTFEDDDEDETDGGDRPPLRSMTGDDDGPPLEASTVWVAPLGTPATDEALADGPGSDWVELGTISGFQVEYTPPPQPKLGRSAYTEGWDGTPPSHPEEAAWMNAYAHGQRNRSLHDAGPHPYAAHMGANLPSRPVRDTPQA